jgi:hypothetical protein
MFAAAARRIRTVRIGMMLLSLLSGVALFMVYFMSAAFLLLCTGREEPTTYFTQEDRNRNIPRWIDQILNLENQYRCKEMWRMDAPLIIMLCELLKDDIRLTPKLTLRVQVFIPYQ